MYLEFLCDRIECDVRLVFKVGWKRNARVAALQTARRLFIAQRAQKSFLFLFVIGHCRVTSRAHSKFVRRLCAEEEEAKQKI